MNKSDFDNRDEFITSLKKGDEQAYEHLMDTYYQRLCVYAISLTNNSMEAQDIVQNVFFRFWKKRHLITIESSIKGLLYKSVYNEYIDHYRKRMNLLRLEERYIEHLNTILETDDYESNHRLMNQIFKIVEALPPKCKETFLLSKKEGLSNIEIADYMKISQHTVERHITKAFKIIRSQLLKDPAKNDHDKDHFKGSNLLKFIFKPLQKIKNPNFQL
ncbi:RNA polymerase sigma factor [Robertkochia solimangrovi]|uniref:RNA polymerase sigma factor n=1 Tax=Robertkochia solimangrovi TaxID=2213046 RepID=UPI00118046B9|nr:RNA polymerase sigma-70 factor [Robertkochia solimangrovi]TRZ41986.1 RNA polymerase sigma-70 factor [Robertkochia solimangrovi]